MFAVRSSFSYQSCLYPINVKMDEQIGPNYCGISRSRNPSEGLKMIQIKKFVFKFFFVKKFKFRKSANFFYEIRELFFTMYTQRTC